jgi:hypothetical protein
VLGVLLVMVLLLLLVLLFLLVMFAYAAPPPQEAAARALLGLSIALDHPALSSSPQVLCAAARSCKAWREAVQQCSVHNTAVVINPRKPLEQLFSFAEWLPNHASLVRSITATAAAAFRHLDADALSSISELRINATQQLLQQALQAAAEGAKAGTASARAGAAAALSASSGAGLNNRQQQQQQQRGWRLASFSSNLPGAPDLLQLLPADSLTHLHLNLQPVAAAQRTSAGLSHLARLSGLQELHLESTCTGFELPGSCLAMGCA